MMRRLRGGRRDGEIGTHDWSDPVPLGYQLAFLSVVLLLGVITAAAYVIQTPVYSPSFEGQWQVWGRTAPLVFRARAPESLAPSLVPGASVQVHWDAEYGLPAVGGYVVSAESVGEEVRADIELKIDPRVPVGATGTARVEEGQRRALMVFWEWLRGR